jgi:hypothetical protein
MGVGVIAWPLLPALRARGDRRLVTAAPHRRTIPDCGERDPARASADAASGRPRRASLAHIRAPITPADVDPAGLAADPAHALDRRPAGHRQDPRAGRLSRTCFGLRSLRICPPLAGSFSITAATSVRLTSSPGPQPRISHRTIISRRFSRSGRPVTSRHTCESDRRIPCSARRGAGAIACRAQRQ